MWTVCVRGVACTSILELMPSNSPDRVVHSLFSSSKLKPLSSNASTKSSLSPPSGRPRNSECLCALAYMEIPKSIRKNNLVFKRAVVSFRE